MKTLALVTFLITNFCLAQSYSDFHDYWYSNKVTLKSSQSLAEFTKKYDYKKDSRFDWVKAVMHMNGVVSNELKTRSRDIKLFVPPKKSFGEFLFRTRKIASSDTRPFCEPISKQYLKKSFGNEFDLYTEYFKLITSREIIISKADDLFSVIANDKYRYQNDAVAVKQVIRSNGLISEFVKKDTKIFLPYCANPIVAEREVASIAETKVAIKPKVIEEPSKLAFGIGIMYGTVNNVQSSKELDMNIIKLAGSISYKVSENYSLKTSGSIAKFTDITYSESSKEVVAEENYFEFGLELSRKYRDMNFGVSYDLLNYFVINGAIAEPVLTHRVSAKFAKAIYGPLILSTSFGYLTSFSDIELSGVDFNFGLTYAFGQNSNYSTTAFIYKSNIENKLSSDTDNSTAVGLSFSYNF